MPKTQCWFRYKLALNWKDIAYNQIEHQHNSCPGIFNTTEPRNSTSSAMHYWPKLIQQILSLLMPETYFAGLRVNTLPVDSLAPEVTRASAGMVLAV